VTVGDGPDETGRTGPGEASPLSVSDDDLTRRRRRLEAALASREAKSPRGDEQKATGSAGYGQALRLSSEFIAAVVVGAGIGWVLDLWVGTSPWGLIVFLLLGFAAGVLNVMRSAGLVADAGIRAPEKPGGRKD
jgi:ATP synthase protein I